MPMPLIFIQGRANEGMGIPGREPLPTEGEGVFACCGNKNPGAAQLYAPRSCRASFTS